MQDTRTQVVRMVEEAIESGNYNLIREASRLCSDESGVWFCESDEYVMVDDEVFYFNGAF